MCIITNKAVGTHYTHANISLTKMTKTTNPKVYKYLKHIFIG